MIIKNKIKGVENMEKYSNKQNEILINYVFKSNKDLNKILKKLVSKFKMIQEVTI